MPSTQTLADSARKQVVPNWRIFGVSLNPGPFTIKEHVLLTIMSTVGAGCASVVLLHLASSDRFYKQRRMRYGWIIVHDCYISLMSLVCLDGYHCCSAGILQPDV